MVGSLRATLSLPKIFGRLTATRQAPKMQRFWNKGCKEVSVRKAAIVEARQVKVAKRPPRATTAYKSKGSKSRTLPEYLEKEEVDALLKVAPHPQAKLLILLQWRAGLRVSEALALEAADLSLDGGKPTLRVRFGKGRRPRLVPVHPELRDALLNALAFGAPRKGRLLPASRFTAWRWVKTALRRAQELGIIAEGRKIGTHTLRHSAARHWLAHGVPVNQVSAWLGHSNLKTTLDTYLPLLPDYLGSMERVP